VTALPQPLAPVHCTACGSALGAFRAGDAGHISCRACRTIHWRNPLPVAGILLVREGRVLLVRRSTSMARAPGRWAYPGGFVELGESAEQAALRETAEEACVPARITGIVGRPHTIRDPHHLVMAFRGEADHEPLAGDEVDAVRWFAPDDIPWDEIAFPSTAVALRALLAEGLDAPPAHPHTSGAPLDRRSARVPAHCPACGGRLQPSGVDQAGRAHCGACAAPFWQNPATTASLLIVRDGRVLLGRRAARSRPGFGLWAGPAGYIDPGESAEQAAQRELEEETTLRGRVSGLITIHSSPTHIEIAYVGESAGEPAPTAEMSELRWFGAADMPWGEAFDTCGDSVRRLIASGLVR